MRSQRVTHEALDGQVHYPDELPRRRGWRATYASLFLMSLVFAVCIGGLRQETDEPVSFLVVLSCAVCMQLGLEVIWRASYYVEEWRHVKSRHQNSHWHLLKKLFLKNTWCTWIFVAACIILISGMTVLNCDIQDHLWNTCISWKKVIGIYFISDVLRRMVNLDKNPVSDSVFLDKLQRLDYGSGMAQNFFYGYLRLVLPDTGDQEKGVIERIEDFTSQQRLPDDSFPVKKLFILIPSSSYLPNDLKDCSFGWMESIGTLEKVVKDRAGVKSRPYKNTVYRIKDPEDYDDKGVYVVAEGATPLKTMYEVVQYSGERQEFFKEHRKEIIFNFYETLREILREDRDCRGLCEFIYYVGSDEFGLDNISVSELILQKINEIRAREAFLARNAKHESPFCSFLLICFLLSFVLSFFSIFFLCLLQSLM